MTEDNKSSADSLIDASRSRAKFSGHGGALGAAGKRQASYDPENSDFLREPGQNIAVNPGSEGFQKIMIAAGWDNIQVQKAGFFSKIMKKTLKQGVDLDLGCLYELSDGTRGVVQAFGKKFGSYDAPPYIALSGDERTGDSEGYDEHILVNGAHWNEIRRILVYVYIYEGAPDWAAINPHILIDIPGENDLVVTLSAHEKNLALCVLGGLENVRGGIKLTNYTEYFPGHAEMDRAFGFGLEWEDGEKQ